MTTTQVNSTKPHWQKLRIRESRGHQLEAARAGINELVIDSRRGKQVTLVDGRQLTEFMSCSYLGLDLGKGATFIVDGRAHASIQINRANLGQMGVVEKVDFENSAALERVAKTAFEQNSTPIFLCDGVGSMRGVAPMRQLIRLCETYAGYAYVDDAHGVSIEGATGCGFAFESLGATPHPRFILTLSLASASGISPSGHR